MQHLDILCLDMVQQAMSSVDRWEPEITFLIGAFALDEYAMPHQRTVMPSDEPRGILEVVKTIMVLFEGFFVDTNQVDRIVPRNGDLPSDVQVTLFTRKRIRKMVRVVYSPSIPDQFNGALIRETHMHGYQCTCTRGNGSSNFLYFRQQVRLRVPSSAVVNARMKLMRRKWESEMTLVRKESFSSRHFEPSTYETTPRLGHPLGAKFSGMNRPDEINRAILSQLNKNWPRELSFLIMEYALADGFVDHVSVDPSTEKDVLVLLGALVYAFEDYVTRMTNSFEKSCHYSVAPVQRMPGYVRVTYHEFFVDFTCRSKFPLGLQVDLIREAELHGYQNVMPTGYDGYTLRFVQGFSIESASIMPSILSSARMAFLTETRSSMFKLRN